MATRKTKVWNIGGGWVRKTTRAGGERFYYHGERKSESSFSAAFERRLEKIKAEREREAAKEKTRKKKSEPRKKSTKEKAERLRVLRSYDLCDESERERFYRDVRADLSRLQKNLEPEEVADLRIIFEIGFDKKGLVKTGKNKGRKRSEVIGRRSFHSIIKFHRFLGLAVNYRQREGNPVDWSPHGACHYRKRCKIARVKMRGERVVGEKKYNEYEFE